jgi:hypothetical protein
LNPIPPWYATALEHHYGYNPRRMKVMIIIICCLLKMLKFHTTSLAPKLLIPLKLEVAVHGTQHTGKERNVMQGMLE